jgi:hypothetical protein
MSVHKSGARKSPQPVHSLIEQKLASFAGSKKVLLQALRGPKTQPLDPDGSWDSLVRIARDYLWLVQMRRSRVPVAIRIKRLGQIAKALGHTRGHLRQATIGPTGRLTPSTAVVTHHFTTQAACAPTCTQGNHG